MFRRSSGRSSHTVRSIICWTRTQFVSVHHLSSIPQYWSLRRCSIFKAFFSRRKNVQHWKYTAVTERDFHLPEHVEHYDNGYHHWHYKNSFVTRYSSVSSLLGVWLYTLDPASNIQNLHDFTSTFPCCKTQCWHHCCSPIIFLPPFTLSELSPPSISLLSAYFKSHHSSFILPCRLLRATQLPLISALRKSLHPSFQRILS